LVICIAVLIALTLQPGLDGGTPGVEEQRIQELIVLLKSPQRDRRRQAVEAIQQLGPSASVAVPFLMEALADKDGLVRYRASVALACIGPKAAEAIPLLCKILKDHSENDVNRGIAANALGRIGKASLPSLLDLLKEKDWEVKSHAAQALRYLGPEAKPALPALLELLQDRHLCRTVVDSIKAVGPAAVPELIKALENPNPYTRVYAATALLKIDPEQEAGMRTLITSLRDNEPGVRTQAARALTHRGAEGVAGRCGTHRRLAGRRS
jgi:HEAT repeat protein